MIRFLIKSFVVVLLYLPLQYLYFKYTDDGMMTTPFMSKVDIGANTFAKSEIVTFGSSIEYMSHPKEVDRRTMTQRLKEYLPNRDIIAFSQPAFTVKLLSPFIQYYRRRVNSDQFYIIELNMDQFSVTDNKRFLDRTPERLDYSENLLTMMYKPLSIFNFDFGVLTDKEFKEQKIYLDGVYQGEFEELFNSQAPISEKLFRDRYMIQYLYSLTAKHEKIRFLKKLIKFLKDENIPSLFYLTPFDYQGCELYFEKGLCDKVLDSNIKVVTDLLKNENMDFLDLSKDLPTKYIATTSLAPNGHLKGEGRDHNAKQIANWIKDNLKDK